MARKVSKQSKQKLQIAAKAGASIRTVERWWRGEGVSEAVAYGLRRAAEDLGITPPTEAPTETP